MKRKTENKPVTDPEKAKDPVNANDKDNPVKRKRGRPKGSIDKTKRKTKCDSTQSIVEDNDRLRMMKFNRKLMKLDRIKDRNNLTLVQSRIDHYLQLCEDDKIMPTVSGLALSFGIDRVTLWDWMTNNRGTIKNINVVNLLKTVYASINAQYEELLTEGKMIPVSAFFLLQNNHGYKQQTDHVITANNDNPIALSDITDRAGLLDS